MTLALSNLSASFKLRFVDDFQIEQFVILLTTFPELQAVSPHLNARTRQHVAQETKGSFTPDPARHHALPACGVKKPLVIAQRWHIIDCGVTTKYNRGTRFS